MGLSIAVSLILALSTVLVHYEALRATLNLISRLTIAPRRRLLVVLGAIFLAHTIEIWLYAVAYYGLADGFHVGGFGGSFQNRFQDFVYFSTETYTSVGFGDVYPLGGLRLIAGIETLTGLLMIGRFASFTYLAMERFWSLNPFRYTHLRRRVFPKFGLLRNPLIFLVCRLR